MKSRNGVTARSFIRSRKRRIFRLPSALRVVGLVNFIGIGLSLAMVLTLYLKGTPHILFQYTYAGWKSHKTSCTYVGLHTQTVGPVGRDCPAIRLLREPR